MPACFSHFLCVPLTTSVSNLCRLWFSEGLQCRNSHTQGGLEPGGRVLSESAPPMALRALAPATLWASSLPLSLLTVLGHTALLQPPGTSHPAHAAPWAWTSLPQVCAGSSTSWLTPPVPPPLPGSPPSPQDHSAPVNRSVHRD